jgi:hypothetical protein
MEEENDILRLLEWTKRVLRETESGVADGERDLDYDWIYEFDCEVEVNVKLKLLEFEET